MDLFTNLHEPLENSWEVCAGCPATMNQERPKIHHKLQSVMATSCPSLFLISIFYWHSGICFTNTILDQMDHSSNFTGLLLCSYVWAKKKKLKKNGGRSRVNSLEASEFRRIVLLFSYDSESAGNLSCVCLSIYKYRSRTQWKQTDPYHRPYNHWSYKVLEEQEHEL